METRIRSFAKAVTWRITGTLDTFLISWFVTGSPVFAVTIAASEVFTKIFLYWLHERGWNKIHWGIK